MPFAFLLALAAAASGTLLTYLYDDEASLPVRACAGTATGFAALGLIGFVFASLVGMTAPALASAGLVVSLPLLLLSSREWRDRLGGDLKETLRSVRLAITRPGKGATGTLIFYLIVTVVAWLVFGRAMYQTPEGIYTGLDNNIGDLPFHVSIISSFVYGDNFPPQHTEFAGVRLTYPFLTDFVAAIFQRAGASLEGALFWQNFALGLSLVGLLHHWASALTRDRMAALMTPTLVLLSGGLGWWVFFGEALGGKGFAELLGRLPHDYTIMGHLGYRWGNAVTALLVPQRGFLLGIPLALVVWSLWWRAAGGLGTEEVRSESEGRKGREKVEGGRKGAGKRKRELRKKEDGRAFAGAVERASTLSLPFGFLPVVSPRVRTMVAAGVIAGLLPLAHAHSFAVMMLTGGCLALLSLLRRGQAEAGEVETGKSELAQSLAPWAAFFAVALVLAAPQLLYATRGSGMNAGSFVAWEFGWYNESQNVVWFWLKNTGFFIPLLAIALALRGRLVSERLFYFYLPFTLCFIIPNLLKLSPWIWDNIKVLFYWWIASAPLVALLLSRLWRSGIAARAGALALLLGLTLAGGLDVWRVASGVSEHRVFDRDGVAFAELVKRETSPRSLVLHAPTYNDPVYLTGRRTFLGYPGHLGSHGLDYRPREDELKRIYAGSPDAARLIAERNVEYVVLSPLVLSEVPKYGGRVNESFFERNFQRIGEAGGYRLYKTTP